MLYCPRCRATYKEGTVRFCTNDNTRLVPAPSKQKSTEEPKGIFTNILGENLLFGEDELLKPRSNRTVSQPKKRSNVRKPLFAPSFEPPKGSRFFKSDKEAEAELEVADEEKVELDLEETETSKVETSFKDVSLAGVVSDTREIEVEEVKVEKEEVIEEDSDDLVGQQLNERYKVVEKIGQDEIGAAYLAQDKIALNKKVIVTVFVNVEGIDDDHTKEIFGDAREVLAQIKHPNIENIIDTGKLPSGDSFIISEFLEGKPLGDEIEKEKQFNKIRTAQIVRQISYGLNEFHQKGFIYRNLRPESVVLCISDAGTEQVKILNPAVSVSEADGKNINYKSPEQIEGNIITIASDTYSLGSIAYLMLTGKMPFEGADAEELFENQKKRPKFAASELRADLPAKIDDVLKKALAFSPADRYLQARHFGDAFYDVLMASFEEEAYTEPTPEAEAIEPIALVSVLDSETQYETGQAEATQEQQEEIEPAEETDLTKETEEEQIETVIEDEGIEVAKYIEDPEDTEEDDEFELADAITETEKSEEVETVLDLDAFDLESYDEESDNVEEKDAYIEIEESEDLQVAGRFDEEPFAETDILESDDEIFETTPVSVASFKSSDDQTIELNTDDENILTEITGNDNEIVEIDNVSPEMISDENEIIELDTGREELPPFVSQTTTDIELDLDDLEVLKEADEDGFELDFGEIDEEESSQMPVNVSVADVLSDINSGVENAENDALPPAEILPDIELNLDSLDETPEIPAIQETLPEIEFDLEEIEEETQVKDAEEIVPEKEVRKPEIRILTPEKPYYKRKEIEEVAENFEEEEIKPVVIKAGEVESTEDSEIGKKVEGDVEEQRDYSWVLLPLLLLLLLIAAIAAFWYFGGKGQDGLIQNTNTPTENNQTTSPDQLVNADQAVINGDLENENTEVAEDSVDSNSETDFFGDNYGAPGGGTSRSSPGTLTNPNPPPPPRTIERSPNKVRYKNTKKNTPRKLQQDFLGFTIDYPKDWKKNSTRNNFLDISKNDSDGTPIKQFLITKYNSTGTYEGDRELFEKLVEKSNDDIRRVLPNFELISEGETTIQDGRWRAYEVRFKGDGRTKRTNKKLTIWGKRFWIPIQRPGMDSGFVITMLVSSLATDVTGIEGVGVDDDLAEILKTFEPTLDN